MRYLLASNADAGSHDEEVLDEVAAVLARHGDVDRLALAPDTADELVTADADRIVVAGGDGTVHHTVAAFVERDRPMPELAVVPLGTGNDLARSIGLDPDDPVEAAELAAAGRARPTDFARTGTTSSVMVNAAHVGLGSVAADVADDLKDRLGVLAYPVGALLAAVREEGWELTVSVDGEPLASGPALLVGVGVGRTIGGGTPLFPDARLDDGLLDVVVVDAIGVAARAPLGLALRRGEHVSRREVTVSRGAVVEIAGEAVVHDVDGELGEPTPRARYEVVPGGLEVVRVSS